jgi:hypothetical protein
MPKLKFPVPLTCAVVQEQDRLERFLKRELDAESQGRIEGHLISCLDCATVFGMIVDREFATTAAESVDAPPFPAELAVSHPYGFGDVTATSWEVLRSLAKGVGQAASEVKSRLDQFQRVWEGAQAFWNMPLNFAAEPLHLGGGSLGVGALDIAHLNDRWESTGNFTSVSLGEITTAPSVTAEGVFRFALDTEDPRLFKAHFICSLSLLEGQSVRFEADPVAVDQKRVRVEFSAADLPGQVVKVPLEFISLQAVLPWQS